MKESIPPEEPCSVVEREMGTFEFGPLIVKVFPPGNSIGMPKLKTLDTTNPALFERITNPYPDSDMTVGVLEIDPYGKSSRQRVKSEKTLTTAALELFSDLDASLQLLADEIRKNPKTKIGRTDYFIGASRLVNSSFFKKAGFETYDFVDEHLSTISHTLAKENYERSGMGWDEAERLAYSKKSKLAVISRDALLSQYS
ncbi:MAG: hypothetical protein WCT02_03205 [Candidatus Paceibacterota bacterium]